MTQMEIQAPTRITPNGYKVDVSRGQRIGRVSSEWFNRPDDERYVSLTDLNDSVKRRSERSKTRIVESEAIRVDASRDNPERLTLMLPDAPHPSRRHTGVSVSSPALSAHPQPICASFRPRSPGSICNMACLLIAPNRSRRSRSKTAASSFGRSRVRTTAESSTHELVEAVQKIAGNGTGDTRWKVPGVLDWSTSVYNPNVDISKDSTTLYASDRDIFVFLVDDLNPIEAGRLPNGEPDLYFRGFYAGTARSARKRWNCKLLHACRVLQSKPLGGRGFPGDHHQAFQICSVAFCP